MESVESFCVNFAASLDVKGNFEAFTFLNFRHVPNNVESTLAVFGGHVDIVTLAGAGLNGPFLDFELGWENIVDVEVTESGIAVVLKENQNFVTAFATQWNSLLSCTEVATVVNDLHGWC